MLRDCLTWSKSREVAGSGYDEPPRRAGLTVIIAGYGEPG
jgi:hypothetical protein